MLYTTTLPKLTHESLKTTDFSNDDILEIIRNVKPNEAHGYDMISIRVMKICDDSVCKPLKFFVLFRKWKVLRWIEKSKWGSRSKSLRGYFMVESLTFLQQKNLTSDNQSDFKQDDSCINQFFLSSIKFVNILMIIFKPELV